MVASNFLRPVWYLSLFNNLYQLEEKNQMLCLWNDDIPVICNFHRQGLT